jgi:mono/diheme cytochrome c family protein
VSHRSAAPLHTRPCAAGHLARLFERGRYFASIVCAECHGLDFRGNRLEGGPSLSVVASFDPQQFRRLLRTGESIGGRKIKRMSSWLPDVGFTDQDITDLRVFLVDQVGPPGGLSGGAERPDAAQVTK